MRRLTDDLPPAAFADSGFVQFLKGTPVRQLQVMLDFFPAVIHRRLIAMAHQRWLLHSVLLGLAVVIALYPTASSQLQSITFSQQWIDLGNTSATGLPGPS
jgi:hypothetical protein